jgi:hypothetical protein
MIIPPRQQLSQPSQSPNSNHQNVISATKSGGRKKQNGGATATCPPNPSGYSSSTPYGNQSTTCSLASTTANANSLGSNDAGAYSWGNTSPSVTNSTTPTTGGRRRKSRKSRKSKKSRKLRKSRKHKRRNTYKK